MIGKKDWTKAELKRLYSLLEELDPLGEEYGQVVQQIDKLERVRSYKNNGFTLNNLLGNLTSIASIGLTLYSEDILNKIQRSKAWSLLPKSQNR